MVSSDRVLPVVCGLSAARSRLRASPTGRAPDAGRRRSREDHQQWTGLTCVRTQARRDQELRPTIVEPAGEADARGQPCDAQQRSEAAGDAEALTGAW